MRRFFLYLIPWLVVSCFGLILAQDSGSPETMRITDKIRADAQNLETLVRSKLAKEFLAATDKLSEPAPRVIYRSDDRAAFISQTDFSALGVEEQGKWTPREYSPAFYFETFYGSPLVYSRILDLVEPHCEIEQPHKLLDFGYGSIGQLQLLAHCGFEAHGVDVDPTFAALYSEPGDTGSIGKGSVAIHTGQWPSNQKIVQAVGTGYSLITSKNTLKAGYIHPSPPAGQTVDPRRLVHLEISDEDFLRRIRSTLAPGGIFIIYNICPPQNPPDQPYLPHADGKSPFSREDYQRAGLEVLAFDVEDHQWVIDSFTALGYITHKNSDNAVQNFFTWYTIVKREAEDQRPNT